MVLPSSEQHCLGAGVRALTAFWLQIVFTLSCEVVILSFTSLFVVLCMPVMTKSCGDVVLMASDFQSLSHVFNFETGCCLVRTLGQLLHVLSSNII